VRYRDGEGYSVERLSPPVLNITSLVSAQDSLSKFDPIKLSVTVENRGGADARDVEVELWAQRDGQDPTRIGTLNLDVQGDSSNRAGLAWTPPEPGTWQIVARGVMAGPTAPPLTLLISDHQDGGMLDLLAVQGFEPEVRVMGGLVLLAAVFLAGAIGLTPWRGRPWRTRSSNRG
jgi:hypothetical protein